MKNEEVEASVFSAGKVPAGEGEAAGASGFDLRAWLRGVKPIRRSVFLYGRFDLLAERDLLGEDLQDARAAGDVAAAAELKARIEALTGEILASRMSVVLEGVSQSRFNETLEAAKSDPEVVTASDVILYQIAAQVVEPAGLGWKELRELDEVIPTQTAKLGAAFEQINNSSPNVEATVPL